MCLRMPSICRFCLLITLHGKETQQKEATVMKIQMLQIRCLEGGIISVRVTVQDHCSTSAQISVLMKSGLPGNAEIR